MKDSRRPRLGLRLRYALVALAYGAVVALLTLAFDGWIDPPWLAAVIAVLLSILPLWLLIGREVDPMRSLFRALAGTVTSYRDGDFAFGLHWTRNDELADLVHAHNALGDTLREQRLTLAQRELLLDTMVQNTPVAMLLFDAAGHVIYGNLAARKLLHDGRRIEGLHRDALLLLAVPALADALRRGGDGLFTVEGDKPDDEQVFHLSRRAFRLNGRPHELVLLRGLSQELRRQEVQTWKKVIRLISHELNNSLAPIASMAHSGAELTRRGQHDKLPTVFAAIEERARHLDTFIRGYAQFAKLPAPRIEAIDWPAFVERLHAAARFVSQGEPTHRPKFDAMQMAQALLNLLKNAHESGSAPDAVELVVRELPNALRIEVLDRGPGMNDDVLAQALLPFYSTKRGGTGLGLALTREIVEAHSGHIALANREAGGLQVTITLPQ